MFECLGADWSPTIGDPTIFGWITVLAYLGCALLSALIWQRRSEPLLRRFWAAMAGLLILLALNKQLDLQTALTGTGRCLFQRFGLYDYRDLVQRLFIIGLFVLVVWLTLRGFRAMRGYRRETWMAMLGLGFVAAYVMIRATSFHMVDALGALQVMGVRANFLLENFGLVLIAVNALGILTGWIEVGPGPQDPEPVEDEAGADSAKPQEVAPEVQAPAIEDPPVSNPVLRAPEFPVQPRRR